MTLDAGIGANSASGSYDIDNSCKFEADNSEYLYKTPSSAGNRKTWTFSAWVKRSEITATANATGNQHMVFSSGDTYLQFDGNAIWINHRYGGSGNLFMGTNRVFRDTSAWYHIVWQLDTTESTAADRAKLWINGVRETSFVNSTYTNMSQNYMAGINNTDEHEVGKYSLHDTTYASMFNGYMAEIHLVDGTALTPTAFGKFNLDGMWEAKQYTGAYGTNGFYLDFKNSSNLGEDQSGNNNDWTLNNLAAADQAIDSPTNNFCVLNNNAKTNGNIIAEEGGTYVDVDGGSGWVSMLATHGVASGKWYWEGWFENNSDAVYVFWGICAANDPWIPHRSGGYYLGNVATGGSLGWYGLNGQVYNGTGSWPGITYSAKLMFALDCDNGKLYFGANGTWGNSSNPATNTNGINYVSAMSGINPADEFILPALSVYQGCRARINFGGHVPQGGGFSIASAASDANGYGTFEYAPPSGYYAICTKNIAEYG